MTKRRFTVEIDCGDTTCATLDGKLCQYVGTSHFGTVWNCMFFRDYTSPRGNEIVLRENDDDWLLRCDKCLEAERTGEVK